MNEIDRIRKLAGMATKEIINEKVELTASAKGDEKLPRASDVPKAMKMAKLKRKVEGEKEGGDVDFNGLFTGVAKGSISIDDKGKIAESNFGIIKFLDEVCGKKHKKKMEEDELEEKLDEVSESDEVGESIEESEMFPKGSLSRYMIEIIVDELKEGKDAKTISEETAFDIKDVSNIVEWFKTRKTKS